MNENPNINLAGIWTPVNTNQVSKNYPGGIASPFQGLLKIGTTNKYSLLVTGWNSSGLDSSGKNIVINVGLFTPDNNGNLYLNTSQFIPDPSTYGAGSVVVADFNGDGLDDIFLAAHSEAPMLPATSTAYIQNNDGTFKKISIGDQLVAHDAQLISINNKPMVLTTTFDASNQTFFSSANPIYYFDNNIFKTLLPNLSWQDLAYLGDGSKTWLANLGMSSVIDTFGTNGQLKLIRGDNATYSADWSKQLSSDISVYNFDAFSGLSNIAKQRITPYLSTLEKYKDYNSAFGPGITHTYRVWSEDLNHDGHLDIMAAQSMWSPQSDNWPNALQLLINDGTGYFIDRTGKLNPDMSLNIEEFSYTPLFIDLDKSGINSYIFTNHANLGYERQTNFVLLNDGTGRIYVALHDQFLNYSKLVSNFLIENKEIINNYTVSNYPYGNPISFIPNPQPNGSINFLAQIMGTKTDNFKQQIYAFVNFGLEYNPSIDFIQNVSVSDRNNSKLLRTWAGNDTFKDTNANGAPAHIDGGLGLDTSSYSKPSTSYNITRLSDSSMRVAGNGISDTLTNVENLTFSNVTIPTSIDLFLATKGTAVAARGAVDVASAIATQMSVVYLGRPADKTLLLDLKTSLDNGQPLEAVLNLIAAKANQDGAFSVNDSSKNIVVNTFNNIMGFLPSAFEQTEWAKYIDNGTLTKANAPWIIFQSYLGANNVPDVYKLPTQARFVAAQTFSDYAFLDTNQTGLASLNSVYANAARKWLSPVDSVSHAASKMQTMIADIESVTLTGVAPVDSFVG